MYFTTLIAASAITLVSAGTTKPLSAEHPAICTASYAKAHKNPHILQHNIKRCCAEVHGKSITFAESKLQGCTGFTLESFEKTEFYNCVNIGLGVDVDCQATHPSTTHTTKRAAKPKATPVYCKVPYGKSVSNQRYIASCCSSAGGKYANNASQKVEKCSGFNLRDSHYNKFIGCIARRNLRPACYPVTPAKAPVVPVTPSKPVVTSAAQPGPIVSVISTPPAVMTTLTTSTTSAAPVEESQPPVNEIASCQAFYSDATKATEIQTCCANAGGVGSLDAESKIASCGGLNVNTMVQKYTDCAQAATAAVACVV